MACHPDLVLRSKTNGTQFLGSDEAGEATICRLCSDVAEDAIQAKCRHIFDRECMKQYLSTAGDMTVSFFSSSTLAWVLNFSKPDCPVCHIALTIDLEAPALELEANIPSARQGILGRLNIETWRSSSKIEALVEELSNLRLQDSTTKSIVFSQFVNFLDLIAFRLQKADFSVRMSLGIY
jgi:DNA repair protein RAD16